jgi:Protein of unknown function (DUF1826)
MNLVETRQASPRPSTVFAASIADLATIYEPHVNVVVHRRGPDPGISRMALATLVSRDWEELLRIDAVRRDIRLRLPWFDDDEAGFRTELAFLIDIYAELFGPEHIGLRMSCGYAAMCPRFHVDSVGVRMVCTYEGAGTEWLDHTSARRERLGHAAKELSDEHSGLVMGPIQRMHVFDIGLLKGEGWAGNVGRGAVHRSPRPSAQRRLFVSLEAI